MPGKLKPNLLRNQRLISHAGGGAFVKVCGRLSDYRQNGSFVVGKYSFPLPLALCFIKIPFFSNTSRTYSRFSIENVLRCVLQSRLHFVTALPLPCNQSKKVEDKKHAKRAYFSTFFFRGQQGSNLNTGFAICTPPCPPPSPTAVIGSCFCCNFHLQQLSSP